MVVNRISLLKVTTDKEVCKMQHKARQLNINIWDETIAREDGAIVPMVHFELDDLILAVKDQVKTTKSRYGKHIKKYHAKLKRIRKKLAEIQ